MELVTLDDVRAAGARIASVVVRTPLLPCPWVKTGRDRSADDRGLWLKPENLQPIGAFKIRGAHNAIARLDEQARARGGVAYASGNHAQALGPAAAAAGTPAPIRLPAAP